MELRIGIILGLLLCCIRIECASITPRFRSTRDVQLPSINNHTTSTINNALKDTKTITNSSQIENKIKLKINDQTSIENEHSKQISQNVKTNRGIIKFQSPVEENSKTETEKQLHKNEYGNNDNGVNKTETGRSLNIDIEKYVSPEFHNKNNVYTLPNSPEIQKYLNPNDEFLSEETTEVLKKYESNFEQFELTTPQSDVFDAKFKLTVDKIKQNLDEINVNTETFTKSDENKFNVRKLIENYKNADNNTDVKLDTTEFKNIDFKTEKSKVNRGLESGKTINYEQKYFKTQTFGEVENDTISPDTELIITSPIKKPKPQISLHNNTIETTAPDNEIKPKNQKHISSDTTNIDPVQESVIYTKPEYENAINITKRGSTKSLTKDNTLLSTSTPSFMDYDNKNFSIPPTATAWTLISLKDVPPIKINNTSIENEQNSQENQLITRTTTPLRGEENNTKLNTIRTKIDYSTTTDSTDATATISERVPNSKTTTSYTDIVTTQNSEEVTTMEFEEFTSTEKPQETTTITEEETQTFSTTIEPVFFTTTSTPQELTSTDVPFETTTDLFTTVQPEEEETTTMTPFITTEQPVTKIIIKHPEISLEDDEIESNPFSEVETDYSEFPSKKDNKTNVNDSEIEIVPIDTTEQPSDIISSTTVRQTVTIHKEKPHETTTIPVNIYQDLNSIIVNTESSTIDATTESLSHDDGSSDENNSGMIAAIVISAIGAVCLVLLAGLLLIMRKRQKRVTYGQRCRPVSLDAYSLDNVSVYNSVRRKGGARASKRSYGNPAFDDPSSVTHQMNFQQLAKFAENGEAINAEFEEIPLVTARTNEVPQGCETKNRYANVIPLPETRVFLKASDNDPHSDYINANYVTGPKNTRGYYIATQGPMNSTVDDFWRMVWEQQCRVILMLTNLYENGIEKCADYLPPSEVLDCHRLFGDFQITMKKREVKEKYIISSLQLKNMVSNSWREVTHLWYLGWPERGVPTESNSLIAFLIEARSHLKAASNNNSSASDGRTNETSNTYISGAVSGAPESGPMIVHCSPGTGRTGTVIACDIAIRDFELSRNVDIPRIVYKVRRDRASAVQTREQYSFIYKVISLYATKLTGGALDSI